VYVIISVCIISSGREREEEEEREMKAEREEEERRREFCGLFILSTIMCV
jgi:hypothetical protein